jgi:plasmid stabilization system protein ParE
MASKKAFKVEWDINEFERFKELVNDTKSRSDSLAKRIVEIVKQNINHIKRHPEMFEQDNLKSNNDGSFRKFNAIHIRIAYKIDHDTIIIARVRHSSSEPFEY